MRIQGGRITDEHGGSRDGPPGSEARFAPEAVLRAVPTAVLVVDTDQRIVEWNPAAEEMTGWPAAAALGQPISIVADPSRREEQQTAFDWVRRTQRVVSYETVRRRRDGEPITVVVRVAPLLHGGELVGYVIEAHDRPVRAEARSEATEHLIAELRARNGELARALARAESDLQDLRTVNQRLRHFAHALSHDLAQPLTALGGHLELLDDDERGLDDRGRQLLARARRSHETLQEAIEATLRHAAAEQGALRRTRLADVVDEVVEAIAPAVRSAGATIVVDQSATVDVEPDAFAGAMQNLFVNACRYRHRDRALRIQVTHEIVGDVDLVRVVDNGIGFADGEHQRVFAHGARGAAGEERAGTGAGLSIVRSIVEDLGGRVWAEDSPGGGATIAIALPRGAPG